MFTMSYLQPVTFFTWCASGEGDEQKDSRRSYTLEDVFNSSMKPKSFSMIWISGGIITVEHWQAGVGRFLNRH